MPLVPNQAFFIFKRGDKIIYHDQLLYKQSYSAILIK